jgi:hypothetical protein
MSTDINTNNARRPHDQQWVSGGTQIMKTIYIPGKLANVVVR